MYIKTGFLIGLTSLIPGISGGTILVLLGNYNDIFSCIADFKNNYKNLLKIILGIILGAVLFSRIIELLFYYLPNGTLIVFSSLIILSLPKLIKQENFKINIFFFLLGAFLIYFLEIITGEFSLLEPAFSLNIIFLITFLIYGAIDGFFTIIPGISGSMIMMILGPYFLYNFFLANLSFTNLIYIIPLLFYFIGDMIGLFLGSKVSLFCLKKIPNIFMSIILGMVLISSIILIPKLEFSNLNILKYLLFFTIGLILYKITNQN